jgi:hypothetical protein
MCSLDDPLVLEIADIPAAKQLHEHHQLPVFKKMTNTMTALNKIELYLWPELEIIICNKKAASDQWKYQGIR